MLPLLVCPFNIGVCELLPAMEETGGSCRPGATPFTSMDR